jgi:hypothetical protein
MFHPLDHPLERGWVGRIEDDHVIHLAAQTLQSFFTGGGTAREHAVYPLDGVRLLVPVLHPPSIRIFDARDFFAFANPAAVVGPDATIRSATGLLAFPRLAAVVARDGVLGGFTVFVEWRRPGLGPPKDRDFALALGPAVLTPDTMDADLSFVVKVGGEERFRGVVDPFDWEAAREFAAEGTVLLPGDLLAGPPIGTVDTIRVDQIVDVELTGIGVLRAMTQRDGGSW